MSVRMYPVKLKHVNRVNEYGNIQSYYQRYHIKPEFTKPTKLKAKRKNAKQEKFNKLNEFYKSKGIDGVDLFIQDLFDLPTNVDEVIRTLNNLFDAVSETSKYLQASKKISNLFEINKPIANFKSFIQAKRNGEKLSKSIRQKRKSVLTQFTLMKELEQYLDRKNVPKHIVTKVIEDNLGNKVKSNSYADMLINTYKTLKSLVNTNVIPSNFLKDKQTFLQSITHLHDIADTGIPQHILNNLLNDKQTRTILEEMLITNPFGIEDEKELLTKMLTNKDTFKHTINTYFQELYKSSDNKRTQTIGELLSSLQEIKNGKPKVDSTMFYSLYKAITKGYKNNRIQPEESSILFFYINGNTEEGKLLPVNYLYHNRTMRNITTKLIETNGKANLSNEDLFTLKTNFILANTITKLPKVENALLFRGENVTPVTYHANKGDLIIYEHPVSTSSVSEYKGTLTYSTIDESGNIKKFKYETKQGAKVFVRGSGQYVRKNSAIIKGTKPEEFEGQKEFLQQLQKELGGIPQGMVYNIKADIAYKVPSYFTTISNKFQHEHLLPPGVIFRVEQVKYGEHYGDKAVVHRNSDTGGVYTLVVKTENSKEFSSYTSRNFTKVLSTLVDISNYEVDEQGRIKPKHRNV